MCSWCLTVGIMSSTALFRALCVKGGTHPYAKERMAEDDGALLGKACADGVDLPKRRCEAEQPANLPRSAFDAWVGLMRRPLWGRRWIAYLPVEWHIVSGILCQQAVQERRACA